MLNFKRIINIFCILTMFILSYLTYTTFNSFKYLSLILFVYGIITGILLMTLVLSAKTSKLNIYKRELEKESVKTDENNSKVKVLEAKIKVLEKALDNAIKNK